MRSVSVMDHRKRDNGLLTFVEHWNIVIVAVVAVSAFKLLDFFMRLNTISVFGFGPHPCAATIVPGEME